MLLSKNIEEGILKVDEFLFCALPGYGY